MRYRQTHRGFTLIELMGVIIIMVIIVAVGALSLPRMGRQLAVNRAGQQVLNAIHHARQLAITQRIPTCIHFKETYVGVALQNAFYGSTAAYGQQTWIVDRSYGYDGRNSTFPSGAVFLYPRGGNDGGPNVAGWANNYTLRIASTANLNLPNGVIIGRRLWTGWSNVYLIRFDRFGTPDLTTTLIISETSSETKGQWVPLPNVTSSNLFYIALTKGSREIRSWRD